jgi:hypothetical protein
VGVVTEELKLVDLEAVLTEEPEASVEVVTEEVEQVDLEAQVVVPMQEAADLEAVAVAHMEDLVDLEPGEVYLEVADMADMAEAELDWEEVASVAVEVNRVLAVQAVAVLLGEDMAVVVF